MWLSVVFFLISNCKSIYGKSTITCDVTDYGAVGDGTTLNTAAITSTVAACNELDPENAYTKIILFPFDEVTNADGITTYLTGSFEIDSDMTLYVQANTVLLGSENEEDYPLIDILPSYGIGRDEPTDMRYQALVFAQNVERVSIAGEGVIDGNGGLWWKKHFSNQLEWSRPPLIEIMYGKGIIVENITLKDSAFWTLHPYASTDIVVQNIEIYAPSYSPNTDGVDVDSCQEVVIRNCFFSVGDDGIAIKSGLNEAGREFNVSSKNIHIKNITVMPDFDNLSTNGISIGSEMSGGVSNVTVEDVFIERCESGIYVKSMEGRGNVVEDIHFRNIRANRTLQAIRFSMNYMYRRELSGSNTTEYENLTDEETPHFRNFYVDNYDGVNIAEAGFITGLEGSIIQNVTISNVKFDSEFSFFCKYADVKFVNVFPKPALCQ